MPMQAQKQGGCIGPTHSQPQRYKGVGGEQHSPASNINKKVIPTHLEKQPSIQDLKKRTDKDTGDYEIIRVRDLKMAS
jgi:hypothetical protein